ncbi:MAG: ATP-dependent DNA ligase [Candidatus Pacebacteria bacterium]|nr:ATP-dependent DNA ligase [Candidatus Paceibacterota bacterium]
MTFYQFAQYLDQLEQTSSRLEMTEILAQLFKKLSSEEIVPASYLMQGELVPKYQSLKFNLSTKLMLQSLAELVAQLDQEKVDQATNLFEQKDLTLIKDQLEKEFKQLGDLGLVAQEVLDRLDYQPDSFSLLDTYNQLVEIARDEGTGSQERKINQTAKLLSNLDPVASKFVVRIIIGKLRLGFSTMTMIDALSWARYADKSDRKAIELAYQKKADIGQLAKGYLAADTKQAADQFLNSYQVEAGTPVIPALCQRLNTAQEIIDKMGKVIVEPKYDGLRAQIHIVKNKAGLEVDGVNQPVQPYQVYTRNLDNITPMFPELGPAVAKLDCQSCILDAEAIAHDPETGQLLPFQETITRRRKYEVADKAEEVPIRFYVFDLLSLDGQSLVDQPLWQRKQKLSQLLAGGQVLQATDYKLTKEAKELRQLHSSMLGEGLEGAVIKQYDSPYRAGRKGWRWVKIKESEGQQGKLSDTLDCVVLGYYRGKGKRAQFGIGAFLVGLVDQPVDQLADDSVNQSTSQPADFGLQIKTIAKIGTGLTDDQFRQFKQLANDLETESPPDFYDVPKELRPDVWLEPGLVVEIAADELTRSPLHSAGQALRFPRLVRFRPDKDWQQATSIEELEQIQVS